MGVATAVSRPRAKKPSTAATRKKAAPSLASLGADIDLSTLDSTHGLAAALTAAGADLCRATEDGHFCEPLDRNLQLWVAIKTMMNRATASVPDAVQGELVRLADRVAAFTAMVGRDFSPERAIQLAEIDLKIAQELIETTLNQMIRDRAYYIWMESGCPQGCDQEHWSMAELEIKGLMNP